MPSAGGAGGRDALPDVLVELPDAAADPAVAPAPDSRDQAVDPTTDARDQGADLVDPWPEVAAPDAISCPDDGLGNATQATAYVLSLPTSANLVELRDLWACPGADDWFVLDLAAGSEMQFEACYDIRTAAPGADVQLSFFREEFPEPSHYPGGGSYGGFETCRGTMLRSAPGRYYFKVTSNQPQGYMVRLYGGPAGPPSCVQDDYEPNDTAAVATPLELERPTSGSVCATDVDWFALDVVLGQRLDFEVVGWLNGYELEMALFSPADLANPLARYPYYPGSDKVVSYPVQQSGVLLIRFRNVSGPSRSYTLTVTQSSS
jgi:hypothetical protein